MRTRVVAHTKSMAASRLDPPALSKISLSQFGNLSLRLIGPHPGIKHPFVFDMRSLPTCLLFPLTISRRGTPQPCIEAHTLSRSTCISSRREGHQLHGPPGPLLLTPRTSPGLSYYTLQSRCASKILRFFSDLPCSSFTVCHCSFTIPDTNNPCSDYFIGSMLFVSDTWDKAILHCCTAHLGAPCA